METQKIVNLLNGSDNENSKLATKNWYIIYNESKGNYSLKNQINIFKNSLESSLCDICIRKCKKSYTIKIFK